MGGKARLPLDLSAMPRLSTLEKKKRKSGTGQPNRISIFFYLGDRQDWGRGRGRGEVSGASLQAGFRETGGHLGKQ